MSTEGRPPESPVRREDAALIMLAGGASRRMGTPKWALDWGGQPLAHHILTNLAPMFGLRLVVAGRERGPKALPAGVEVVFDPEGLEGEGPLVALLGALRYLRHRGTRAAFLTACDMPLLQIRDLEVLHRAFLVKGGVALWPVEADDGGTKGRGHPLCAWIDGPAMLKRVEGLVATGERRLRAAFCAQTEGFEASAMPDPTVLAGCNTPEAYERLRAEATVPIRRG